MENGFRLIKTRALNDKIDIDLLETKYTLKLPPLYRLFCSLFEGGSFRKEEYLDPVSKDKIEFAGTYYFPKGLAEDNIGITSLYNVEQVFTVRESLEGYSDGDLDKGLIRIADIGLGGGLFVGTNGIESDCILLCIWDKTPMYEILANNIFEFVQGLVLEPMPDDELGGHLKVSQLYKNWGEEFWRVKQDLPRNPFEEFINKLQ